MTKTSVIQLQAVLTPIELPALLPGYTRAARIREDPSSRTLSEGTPPSEDQGMVRALKLGALFGVPGVFVVVVALAYLGGAGLGPALLCGGWSAVFGGFYLGGVFFVAGVHEPDSWLSNDVAQVVGTVPTTIQNGDTALLAATQR